MPTDHRAKLATIKSFPQLVAYLRDEMGWPIESDDFEELTFEYTPEELGIDLRNAAKIQEIKRLRPLAPSQPWGIFFIKFEPKRLPVVALRRILGQVALKKRASSNKSERQAWAADDLLFVSNYGEGGERQIAFAHFAKPADGGDLPTLKVLGWDNRDTLLHLDHVAEKLSQNLAWPGDPADGKAWRESWRAAFTLRHREVITTSKLLSVRLAELARTIRDRIEAALAIETDKGPLTQFMKAFQEALVHDLDADGFADMYAQTIAYGLLSARIADPHKKTADDFAAHMRTNPFLRELMETFLKVGGRRGKAGGPGIDFDELGVSEVVELLDDANMEAVVRDFGDRNPQEDPVIHFYELFLKEYDAKKRMQRGVFYTPRPVVSYIVRSVDELLRTEFGLVDGLADTTTWGEVAKRHKDLKIPEGVSADQDFIQILDPATGTGTFLVEVIDLIHKTLLAKWKTQGQGEKNINALWNEYVPKHLLTRLHGYELLMAPYAIAHLKVGLKLYETGYRFGSDERVRVYLTNALEPASEAGQQNLAGLLPALAHEAHAVNEIKGKLGFTVVLGNPPYSSVSSNRIPWSDELIEAYKHTVRREETQIQVLSDDYVRFFAFGEFQLDRSGAGVLCMISNNNFWSGRVFRDMRGVLLASCDRIDILDLHGNSRLGEQTADGSPDANVFDIVQGVGVTMLSRILGDGGQTARLFRQDVWGDRDAKYAWLLNHSYTGGLVQELHPKPPLVRFDSGGDEELAAEYESFTSIPSFFGTGSFATDKTKLYGTGFKSQQDDFAIAFRRSDIAANVEALLDQRATESGLRKQFRLCTTSQWSFSRARGELRADGWERLVTTCLYRPFDKRWTVFHRGVISNLRRETMLHLFAPGGLALCTMRGTRKRWENHALIADTIVGKDCVSPLDMCFVFPTTRIAEDDTLVDRKGARHSNLNQMLLRSWKAGLRARGGTAASLEQWEEAVVNYIYACLYSRAYQSRYADFLPRDFPRVPVALNPALFRTLAVLGSELRVVHLMRSPKLNKPISEFIGGRNPEVEKVSWSRKSVWIDKAQTAGFKGVPEEVWNFQIGGYQVCEKWLKDRKGCTLTTDDIAHYQRIVVALAETIRLMEEIDEVIEEHGGWPGAFAVPVGQGTAGEAEPPSLFEYDTTQPPLRKVAEREGRDG